MAKLIIIILIVYTWVVQVKSTLNFHPMKFRFQSVIIVDICTVNYISKCDWCNTYTYAVRVNKLEDMKNDDCHEQVSHMGGAVWTKNEMCQLRSFPCYPLQVNSYRTLWSWSWGTWGWSSMLHHDCPPCGHLGKSSCPQTQETFPKQLHTWRGWIFSQHFHDVLACCSR